MSAKKNTSITKVAAESLDEFEIVELDSSDPPKVQTPGTEGNAVYGVTQGSTDADGDTVSVVISGLTRVKAAESINEGEWLMAATSGQAKTATSTNHTIGKALEDAASGDQLEIRVAPQMDPKD